MDGKNREPAGPANDRRVQIARRVKEILVYAKSELGIRQVDIANRCGTSEAAVSLWTRTGEISTENAAALCDITGFSMDYIYRNKRELSAEVLAWAEKIASRPELEQRRLRAIADALDVSDSESEEA